MATDEEIDKELGIPTDDPMCTCHVETITVSVADYDRLKRVQGLVERAKLAGATGVGMELLDEALK